QYGASYGRRLLHRISFRNKRCSENTPHPIIVFNHQDFRCIHGLKNTIQLVPKGIVLKYKKGISWYSLFVAGNSRRDSADRVARSEVLFGLTPSPSSDEDGARETNHNP